MSTMSHAFRFSDDTRDSEGSRVDSMLTSVKYAVALYVDRSTQQWVVRDPEGNFWLLPADDDCWQNRRPFHLTEDTDLEVVPGHYQYMLNLPF